MDATFRRTYTRPVAKYEDGVPSHYPCLTQKDGLRRVHHPHADHLAVRKRRVRRALAKLVEPLRAWRSAPTAPRRG